MWCEIVSIIDGTESYRILIEISMFMVESKGKIKELKTKFN